MVVSKETNICICKYRKPLYSKHPNTKPPLVLGFNLMAKRYRLLRKISGPDFECIRKPDKKKCLKSDHLNTGRFGIRMFTVIYMFVKIQILVM
jgi:hypothetical protein